MKSAHSLVKPVITALLVTNCFAFRLISVEKTYSPKNGAETQILSLVLKAEFQANNWAKNEKVCFSVEGLDPSPELVKALRQQDLNVRSAAEWRKKLSCGFEIHLQFQNLDSSQNSRVHSVVGDLRDINNGEGHFEVYQRDGEYLLRKIDGEWSIREYFPSKKNSKTQ